MKITGSVFISDHAVTRFRERVTLGEILHNEKGIIRAMIEQGYATRDPAILSPFKVYKMGYANTYVASLFRTKQHCTQVLIILSYEFKVGYIVTTVRTKGEKG